MYSKPTMMPRVINKRKTKIDHKLLWWTDRPKPCIIMCFKLACMCFCPSTFLSFHFFSFLYIVCLFLVSVSFSLLMAYKIMWVNVMINVQPRQRSATCGNSLTSCSWVCLLFVVGGVCYRSIDNWFLTPSQPQRSYLGDRGVCEIFQTLHDDIG